MYLSDDDNRDYNAPKTKRYSEWDNNYDNQDQNYDYNYNDNQDYNYDQN